MAGRQRHTTLQLPHETQEPQESDGLNLHHETHQTHERPDGRSGFVWFVFFVVVTLLTANHTDFTDGNRRIALRSLRCLL